MAQAAYSFLDVAALDAVRERFARGEALVVLSIDLAEVIWANGPGAALFGHADVETIFGAQAPIGPTARRQISGLRGFPVIGRDRALLVRIAIGIASTAMPFRASTLTMPDGEEALLLAQAGMEDASHDTGAAARRATTGFAQGGHFVAILDRSGQVEAASKGFERLGLATEALASLSSEATAERRIVKRMLSGKRGPLPAGLARLTESRNLVVVVDENWAELPEEPAQGAGQDAPAEAAREIWYLGSDPASEPKPEEAATGFPATIAIADLEQSQNEPGASTATWDGNDSPPETAVLDIPELSGIEPSPVAETPDAGVSQAAAQDAAAPVVDAPAEPAPAAQPAGPVRFVWRTDAQGRFSQVSADFAAAVGAQAADIVGRNFQDVASVFGLDPSGDIAGLMARRDTWSGRTVSWPVAGTDLTIPVDLAALPVYDRTRKFEGFRGFGVARTDNPSVDPKGVGMALAAGLRVAEPLPPDEQVTAEPQVPGEIEVEPTASEQANDDTDKSADPFLGEKPAITVTPVQDRRYSDKVIRLAEHRQPAQERPIGSEKSLSTGERIAFQQIAERLRKDSGPTGQSAETASSQTEAGADLGEPTSKVAAAPHAPADHEMLRDERVTDAQSDDGADTQAIADLEALDGVKDEASARLPDEPAPATRKGPRPGMSLLDFAQWSKDEPEQPSAEMPAASVEMDDAAALLDAGPVGDEEKVADTDLEPVAPAVETAIEAQEAAGADKPPAHALPLDSMAGGGLSILEKLPVPVLVHSGDELHYANHEFFALTGYGTIEELARAGGIGALFSDPYQDDPGHEAHPKTDRYMRLQTRNGEDVPVEAFLQSVPWNGGKALVLVLSRVKAGALSSSGQSPLIAELEARVAEMRTIIDTATDGVVLISREGNIRSISRPAEALFGLDSDEVVDKPFASLFAIESQKSARDYLNGLSDHGVASVLNDGREVIGREAEGRFIPLFMTIGKLPGDSGYCAVVRDITQWKRAEEELTQARATAERTSSHKTDFLARVSHEIRTPLNAIIGFSELMLDEKFGPVANDRYRDYLRDINRSGNHVLDLVNDLLDISKIEAGQQEMAYEAVSLNDALSETVALMQPQANRERVIIRSSFASKLPDVVADLRSVRQIALNVLSNAVRYTQAGGQVIVSTAYESDGEVVMRVRDTGIGMTPGEIEQALKPFKQINSLKRTRGDGTGLGLPLTKAMVEANRAKFSIHSTPGEGTLVEVAFPPTRVLAD
ncbi:MAG: PAS domain-containing sensor histidine kinase [Hyphomicrobiales bacterium]|nr:PAS domain-containing sensor histidine kinase [Hyphomicrobiales bacterium]